MPKEPTKEEIQKAMFVNLILMLSTSVMQHLGKVKNPEYGTYTNVMSLPGPDYETLLDKHTKWHLYLLSVSPLVRIGDIETTPLDGGFYRISASVENRGGLPTNVSAQAILSETAAPVTATLTLDGATLVAGEASVDLGHLSANSTTGATQWLVKVSGSGATVVITATSQKGGTDAKTIYLN